MPEDAFPQKTRLSMRRCSLGADGRPQLESDEFIAMINPAELKLDRRISYSPLKAFGQLGSDVKFSAVDPEKVSLSLVLDGTGVVPPATAADAGRSVRDHLDALLQVVYKTSVIPARGDRQAVLEPSRVRLLWGSFIFYGRMESMATQYTLFRPNGEPLRAKVTLSFVRFLSKGEDVLQSNAAAQGLTRTVSVREGDTLATLCDRIYGDAGYAPQIAEANGLSGLRALAPGTTLQFPPLA